MFFLVHSADRANRKYYRFDSISAILISNEERVLDDCLLEVTQQNPELLNASRQQLLKFVRKTLFNHVKINVKKDATSTKVNGYLSSNESVKQSCIELLMCTADPSTCTVHSLPRDAPTWSFFYDKFDLEDLENNLNKRGIRESELLQVIKNDKDRLLNIMSQTPVSTLNPDAVIKDREEDQKTGTRNSNAKKGKDRYEDANLGYPTEMLPEEVLENALLDNILEMEEKIYAGNLGK